MVRHFGEEARVFLFGSRVDDSKKGGDIDILIRADYSPEEMFLRKLETLTDLHFELGERKIDVVTSGTSEKDATKPVVWEALKSGVEL